MLPHPLWGEALMASAPPGEGHRPTKRTREATPDPPQADTGDEPAVPDAEADTNDALNLSKTAELLAVVCLMNREQIIDLRRLLYTLIVGIPYVPHRELYREYLCRLDDKDMIYGWRLRLAFETFFPERVPGRIRRLWETRMVARREVLSPNSEEPAMTCLDLADLLLCHASNTYEFSAQEEPAADRELATPRTEE